MIQKPYAPAAIPQSGQYPTTNQGFPQSNLLGAFISKLPYAYQIIDSMVRKNPKYEIFRDVTSRRDDIINDESIFVSQPNDPNLNGNTSAGIVINKDYQSFVYASVDKDKANRLADYRRMSSYAEMADCMDEISDECIVKDENDDIVTFKLRGEYSQETKDTVEKEFKKFINIFDLEDTGWEYFRQFLTDGELFFENVIDEENPDLGIVGIVSIPCELINPVYQNTQNDLIKGFLLIKPIIQPIDSINKKSKEEILFLQKSQVTYVHTGIWNEFKTIRLPYIENAKRAYRQLSLIEDSIVIYRLVRAPERLVFKVFTGNMPAPKAEAYLKRLMQQYWSRKNYDTTSGGSGPAGGRVTNVYDPQSMLDSYWFPKDAQGNGTDVSILPGGCLAMDTKIPLLDGRTLTLSELTVEYNEGKENWIYSTNPDNGHIAPGKISWAGVTQKSAKVMELTFDNEKTLICTLDHKFPILGKGEVQAKDLIIGESMIPFYTKEEHITKFDKKSNKYHQIYQNDTKEWQFTHKMVVNSLKDTQEIQEYIYDEQYNNYGRKEVIHHKNCWRFNNNPENLVWMNKKDHTKYHSDFSFKHIMGTIKENDPERYQKLIDQRNKNASNSLKIICNMLEYKKGISERSIERWKNKEYRDTIIKSNIDRWSNPENKAKLKYNMSIHFTKDSLKCLIDIIKDTGITKQKFIVKYLNENPCNALTQQFIKDNPNDKIWKRKFDLQLMKRFVRTFGYKNYPHFRKDCAMFNHRLVSVKYLDNPIEVGTLTIDKEETYHNYHNFALDCGIFTKNSNLGSLEDLNYFLKKLYKAMKVPASRFIMDSGGSAKFTDGTEITREELRFARYIIRIQRQFATSIRDSFIVHLKLRKIWKECKLRERAVNVEFNVPTSFMAMREQELLKLKFDNFSASTQNQSMAPSYAQKYYLGLTDEQMTENREWLRKDAEMEWELTQIKASGPNFREQIAAASGGATESVPSGGVGGGGEMPSGSEAGGAEIPPEFGNAEAGTPPEGGGEAPAGGTEAPAEQTPPPEA